MLEQLKNRINRISVNYKRFGIVHTIKYLIYNGVTKRALNRINFIIKNKKYPQNIIFISSLPKSGSTWLSNMCAEVDGFDSFAPNSWNTYIAKEWDDTRWDLTENIFSEFDKNLAVIRGHTWATSNNLKVLGKSDLKYLIGVRDPRDKFISEYYHSRNFPGHWAHDEAYEKTLDEFIDMKLKNGDFEKETIDWIRRWLSNRDNNNSMIIKYEDLLKYPHIILSEVFRFLKFKIDKSMIDTIIDKHSFKKVTGRIRGETDNTKFIRKGIAGEWKSLFSDEQKKIFSNIGEDVINKLGYEPTVNNG